LQEYRESIAKCGNLADLDKIRVALLGKKGAITSEFAKLKELHDRIKGAWTISEKFVDYWKQLPYRK